MQSRLVGVLIVVGSACFGGAIADQTNKDALSQSPVPFAKVSETVAEYFQNLPDHQVEDLITRQHFEPLISRLEELGFPPAELRQIAKDLLDEHSFLVRELFSPQGRQFMRRIARYPQAYDRLDRLSQLPDGHRIVRKLIRGPGGEKMLEYLTKSSGGRELGKMLSRDSEKKEFNRPTGRIYTQEMLLKRLEQIYINQAQKGENDTLPAKSDNALDEVGS